MKNLVLCCLLFSTVAVADDIHRDWDENKGSIITRIRFSNEQSGIDIYMIAEQKTLLGFENVAVTEKELTAVEGLKSDWQAQEKFFNIELGAKCSISSQSLEFNKAPDEDVVSVTGRAKYVCTTLKSGLEMSVLLKKHFKESKSLELILEPKSKEPIQEESDGTKKFKITFEKPQENS